MVSKHTFEKVCVPLCIPSIYCIIVRQVGIPVFGPSALAARMEGSKGFSKVFMAKHSIPTAAFRVFSSSQFDDAVAYVKSCGHRVVLKADGLAAGKGVLLPETTEEAIEGLREILIDRAFGDAGWSSCLFCAFIPRLSFQVPRLLWKNSSKGPRFLFSPFRMDIPSRLFLPVKTTSGSETGMWVRILVEWEFTHQPQSQRPPSWNKF